jgi:hypothetical protein
VAIADVELDRILKALVAWPAILPLPAVPACLELSLEASTVVLRELLDRQLVSIWQSPTIGPCLVLTEVGVSRVGVELYDPIPFDTPRWADRPPAAVLGPMHWFPPAEVPREKARPPSRNGERLEADLAALNPAIERQGTDAFPDRRARSPEAVEFEPGVTAMVVLGLGLVGWCPAVEAADPPCPVCGGRPLAWREVCIACTRTGLDFRLESVRPEERPRHQYRPADPGGLAGGTGEPGQKRQGFHQGPRLQGPRLAGWRLELEKWRRQARRRPS